MSPRAASVLVDLAIWGLPIFLFVSAVYSRLANRSRRRAVRIVARPQSPAVRPVTVTVVPPTAVTVATPQLTDEEFGALMDLWTASAPQPLPEQRRPA